MQLKLKVGATFGFNKKKKLAANTVQDLTAARQGLLNCGAPASSPFASTSTSLAGELSLDRAEQLERRQRQEQEQEQEQEEEQEQEQ